VSHNLPHTAKSVFFSCIDDRLTEAHMQFIKTLAGGAFHPSLAGGGAAFLSDDTQAAALKQVVASYNINHITDVYLESHTDCGAYRLASVTFDNATAEVERLSADLERAKPLILAALVTAGAKDGEVTVHLRVVDPSGHTVNNPQPA
jgi:carbonic anhydrase